MNQRKERESEKQQKAKRPAFRRIEDDMIMYVLENYVDFKGTVSRILRIYLGVRSCEVFLCFVAIVRVRVYCVNFFVFFVLRHW